MIKPQVPKQSARIFKNKHLEALSKVHPSVPLLIYTPVIIFFLYRAFLQLPVLLGILFFVFGTITWSFTEYVLHRFLFHHPFHSKLGKRFHFIMHGVHHQYPQDPLRLVMPPSVSIPLAFFFYYLFNFFLGESYILAFYPGFVTGYLIYDMLHFAFHHFHFTNPYLQTLKTHHMKHHYLDSKSGFGVSSKLWDYIFLTHQFRKKIKNNN
ncbi:MAG: sterol desaturase family protein [Bacteroidia bacterium]|nr:sterol desaturase family protein [Bacteroidia bacterium]MDW8159693.1 sterol desaturase family protein [Bacteroidia bacterium]